MNQQVGYRTFGYFYKNEAGYSCRKYLDIKSADTAATHPELIILMLNPGNCGEREEIGLNKEVEVTPDASLMRVQAFIERHGLSWARVLNLSDVSQKSGDSFFRKLGKLESELPGHSIFHGSRAADLRMYAAADTPFFLAWGLDPRSSKLAGTALAQIRDGGYRMVNEDGPHYHPLVRPAAGVPLWNDHADTVYRQFVAASAAKPDSSRATQETGQPS